MRITAHTHKHGFTLIEVMAAMVILVGILLIVGRMMADTTEAYDSGVSTAQVNDNGRAIFDFIMRDIASAVSSESNVVFAVDSSSTSDYGDGDELRFVNLSSTPESSERESAEIRYYIREMSRREGNYPGRYQLMRSEQSGDGQMTAYTSENTSLGTAAVIAENVSRFYVYAYAEQPDYAINNVLEVSNGQHPGLGTPTDFSSIHMNPKGLPLFVDVFLELLGEKDSVLIGTLANEGVNVESRVADQAKRFFGRIHLKNRVGYTD